MSDFNLVFVEFDKFARLETVDKETLTEDDIDLFLTNFLAPNSFFYHKGLQISCANKPDRETGETYFTTQVNTFKPAVKAEPVMAEAEDDDLPF